MRCASCIQAYCLDLIPPLRMAMLRCSICGASEFTSQAVLWPELASAWGLSAEEVSYVNQQQGCACTGCGASLRVVALGDAIRDALATTAHVQDFVRDSRLQQLRILDLNGAAAISGALARLSGYVLGNFPEVDMEALPYPSHSFDLVVHSDTLEHVPHPIRGLEECRRVLKPGGRLCFTIPVIVGRLTRGREGLPKSWHGDPSVTADDFLVHTEFGADMWTFAMRAGFDRVTIHQVAYPAATAITAWNGSTDV